MTRIIFAGLVASMVCGLSQARAAVFFTTNFAGASLNANLQTAGPATWSTGLAGTGGLTGNQVLAQTSSSAGAVSRSYVETIATDYNMANFALTVTYSQSAGDSPVGLVFIGFGNPVPRDGNYEPGTAIIMRLHPSSYDQYDGMQYHDVGDSRSGNEPGSYFPVGAGVHTVKIVKSGSDLTFYMDAAHNGNFVQWGDAIDLSSPTYSYLNDTNSRLFLGTGDTQPQFLSFDVTGSMIEAVPEPGSVAMLGAGLLGLAMCYRTRRRYRLTDRDAV